MTTQIWLDHTGGPEVLQVRTVDRDAPGPGQVWLDQEAIGVNYLDVTQRMGAVPIPLPGGLGLEGAGTVVCGRSWRHRGCRWRPRCIRAGAARRLCGRAPVSG